MTSRDRPPRCGRWRAPRCAGRSAGTTTPTPDDASVSTQPSKDSGAPARRRQSVPSSTSCGSTTRPIRPLTMVSDGAEVVMSSSAASESWRDASRNPSSRPSTPAAGAAASSPRPCPSANPGRTPTLDHSAVSAHGRRHAGRRREHRRHRSVAGQGADQRTPRRREAQTVLQTEHARGLRRRAPGRRRSSCGSYTPARSARRPRPRRWSGSY